MDAYIAAIVIAVINAVPKVMEQARKWRHRERS
jgi:hypothetical protein